MRKNISSFTALVILFSVLASCKKEYSCEGCAPRPAQQNHLPVARAGTDQIIYLPTNATNLDGSGSTDPDNNITTYLWTKISGPPWFGISNGNSVQAQVNNLIEGSYVFELKITDAGGLYDLDTIIVTVENSRCDNSNRPFINARLIPIGTLSIARQELSAATAGNKIVFAGGIQATGESAAVDIYDLVTQTWSTASLSTGRVASTAISTGNKIFFAGGGYIYSDYYSNVDIYDVSVNTWTKTSLTEPKTGIGAAVIGNKVMFAGGYRISGDLPNNAVKTIDIYDLTTNTWSLNNLSEARGNVCGITVGK